MSEALKIARLYFELSNRRDLPRIAELMTDSTTYSSDNTGLHLGQAGIMEMQRSFFERFEELHWEIASCEEVRPGIVRLAFVLTGRTKGGETLRRTGIEHVVVHRGKLQHIEVRNA